MKKSLSSMMSSSTIQSMVSSRNVTWKYGLHCLTLCFCKSNTSQHASFLSCLIDYFEGTYKNKKLYYRKYLPKNGKPPKAVVVWHHGIHGQSGYGMKCKDGRYTTFALRCRAMPEGGIALYALDLLGHGFSEGDRFYIPEG